MTSRTGEFNTVFKLLQRLRQRYYTLNDIIKAVHMFQYDALKEWNQNLVLSLWIERSPGVLIPLYSYVC